MKVPRSELVRRRIGAGIMLIVVAAQGGCMVGPNFQSPKATVPDAWTVSAPAEVEAPHTLTTAPADAVRTWWTQFGDAELEALIDRAVTGNLDLQAAQRRIRQARAARGVAQAALWPGADTSGSYARVFPRGASASHDLFQAGLDAVWELDIFGGTRRNVEAAEADIAASIEDYRDVKVTLAAEVALDYITLRSLERQLDIARRNLETQKHSAQVSQQQFDAGLVSGLDVANANAQVATTAAQIPLLQSAEQQTMYALSVLLGRMPLDLSTELSEARPIPAPPKEVPIGLPSDLLRRRPDIRAAEARLHGATARVGVATADLFPKISLTGSLGLESDQLKSVTSWSNRFWSIGPSVSWPIFDAGRIRSNIRFQEAAEQEALITYGRTVLTALQEVQSALVAYAREQEHRKLLSDAVTADRKAVDLSNKLYTQGQIDYLRVLDAERSLLASETALAQSDEAMSSVLISLYKALGGGWDLADDPH